MTPSPPTPPASVPTPPRDTTTSPPSVSPSSAPTAIVAGPERPSTSIQHLKMSEAWIAAIKPQMRLRIRRWLRIRLRRRLGRAADGRPLHSVDAPHTYPPQTRRRAAPSTPGTAMAVVAGQAAFAARSRDAMRRATVETQPQTQAGLVLPGNDLEEDFDLCVRHVTGKTLTSMQRAALLCLFQTNSEEKKLRLVQPTGAGKSLVILGAGLLLCGVHLVVHPLLVLTADQVASFSACSQQHGTVVVLNMDDQASVCPAFLEKIISLITLLEPATSTTVFLFASPQFIATKQNFVNALFACRRRGLLRLVALDEIDLLARQGASFRAVIRKTAHSVLKPLLSRPEKAADRCFHLQLTASLSAEDELCADQLVGVAFPGPYTMRASWREFCRDNIVMNMRTQSHNASHYDVVIEHVTSTPGAASFVFSNTRSAAKTAALGMESKLDEVGSTLDVILVDGTTSRHDKFTKINLFCGRKRVAGYDPRILSTTAASDQGVDHPGAHCILNLGWPDSLAAWIQRMGRAGRRGEKASATIVAGLAGLLYLTRRANEGLAVTFTDETSSISIDTASKLFESPSKLGTKQLQQIEKKFALTDTQKQVVSQRQLSAQMDVLKLFCLNLGCQHRRLQRYQASGSLAAEVYLIHPCGNACPVCTGEWPKLFRPMWKNGLMLFFENVGEFPCDATVDKLMELVIASEFWTKAIFDVQCKTLRRYHYEAMYLQLIAAGLLGINTWRGNLCWVLQRESREDGALFPPFRYKRHSNWKGLSLVASSKKRHYPLDIANLH